MELLDFPRVCLQEQVHCMFYSVFYALHVFVVVDSFSSEIRRSKQISGPSHFLHVAHIGPQGKEIIHHDHDR